MFDISDSLSILGSFTSTIQMFGSIVQKGKFAASALYDLVNALKSVDLPTFGSHTIQIFIGVYSIEFKIFIISAIIALIFQSF
ncbi:MAG: hypothetical protein ACOZBL_04645 [Patescibacteria group bacterium]